MLEKLKDIQSIVIARILRIGFHIAAVRLTKHGGTAVLLVKRRSFTVRTVEVNESGLCNGVSFSEWIETLSRSTTKRLRLTRNQG